MADIRNPETLAVARSAVDRLGSITSAATMLLAAGYRVGRCNLSRYLNNDLDNVVNVEAAIVACFDQHRCPYLGLDIPAAHCREVNVGPVPTWDPAALDQRRCCQTCAHKPSPESKGVPNE